MKITTLFLITAFFSLHVNAGQGGTFRKYGREKRSGPKVYSGCMDAIDKAQAEALNICSGDIDTLRFTCKKAMLPGFDKVVIADYACNGQAQAVPDSEPAGQ